MISGAVLGPWCDAATHANAEIKACRFTRPTGTEFPPVSASSIASDRRPRYRFLSSLTLVTPSGRWSCASVASTVTNSIFQIATVFLIGV